VKITKRKTALETGAVYKKLNNIALALSVQFFILLKSHAAPKPIRLGCRASYKTF
jgi:hypothetical protein